MFIFSLRRTQKQNSNINLETTEYAEYILLMDKWREMQKLNICVAKMQKMTPANTKNSSKVLFRKSI